MNENIKMYGLTLLVLDGILKSCNSLLSQKWIFIIALVEIIILATPLDFLNLVVSSQLMKGCKHIVQPTIMPYNMCDDHYCIQL